MHLNNIVKNNMIKIISIMICVLILIYCSSVPALANSAQARWEGVTSTGMIVTEENCPLEVKRELLKFDIQ